MEHGQVVSRMMVGQSKHHEMRRRTVSTVRLFLSFPLGGTETLSAKASSRIQILSDSVALTPLEKYTQSCISQHDATARTVYLSWSLDKHSLNCTSSHRWEMKCLHEYLASEHTRAHDAYEVNVPAQQPSRFCVSFQFPDIPSSTGH